MENLIFELALLGKVILVGIISAFTGIFYRNCLQMKGMIFKPLYKVFLRMHIKGGVIRWISYPLGYCVYCSTTWISIIAYIIVVGRFSLLIFITISIQHIIVMYFDKHYLNRPEFN